MRDQKSVDVEQKKIFLIMDEKKKTMIGEKSCWHRINLNTMITIRQIFWNPVIFH